MSPWRAKGRNVYKARLYDRDGVAHVRTLHTEDEDEALRIDAMCEAWRTRRQWHFLDLLIQRKARATDLLDAYEEGRLAAFVADLDAAEAEAASVDLDPVVAEWAARGIQPTYVRQVRAMIPEGERFALSQFRRSTISRFLAALPHSGPTKNRYRAALRLFGRHLVELEHLGTNPVRDVRGYPEHDPRMIHHTREQAQAIIGALQQPFAALEALMAGAGCEWSAATRVRGRDIRWETREVWADGAKNPKGRGAKWRKRWVRFTEDWAWDVFAQHARGFSPLARVFGAVHENTALRRHHDACARLDVPDSVLHDWRHTYAIYSLAAGIAPQAVKHNLGHSPHSTELDRVYAAWIPTRPDDFLPRGTAATPAATPTSKRLDVRTAK